MNTQQILQAMSSLQSNAQDALPVIPNNGNPGGANNMPQNNQVASTDNTPPPPPNPYQWLEPSPAVASTNKLLEEMAAKLRRDMYNESLSESKYRLIPHADGSTEAQLLTNDGSEFDPYNLNNMLPLIPINQNTGIEKNIAPVLPRGNQT